MNKISISNSFHPIVMFIGLSMISGCSPENEETLTFPIKSNQVSGYYTSYPVLNKGRQNLCENYLLPKYQAQTKLFNTQEQQVPVKGELSTYEKVTAKIAYFEFGHFKMGDYLYRIIVFNRPHGLSESMIFNTQLNSYDNNGILKDALLLDSRFCYEEIERFSDFTIDDRGFIDINRYIIQVISIYDGGELGEEIKDPKTENYAKEQYQIDNGVFRLVSQKKFSK